MDRKYALILTLLFFVLFSLITYFGANVTIWSSINFSIFTTLILLNIFYPPNGLAMDSPDFTLFLYAAFEIIGIFILSIYIIQKSLSDIKTC